MIVAENNLTTPQGFSHIIYAREQGFAHSTRARGDCLNNAKTKGSILHTNTKPVNDKPTNLLIDWPFNWPMIDFK